MLAPWSEKILWKICQLKICEMAHPLEYKFTETPVKSFQGLMIVCEWAHLWSLKKLLASSYSTKGGGVAKFAFLFFFSQEKSSTRRRRMNFYANRDILIFSWLDWWMKNIQVNHQITRDTNACHIDKLSIIWPSPNPSYYISRVALISHFYFSKKSQ